MKDDAYDTPDWAARAGLKAIERTLPWWKPSVIVDPSVGCGVLLDEGRKVYPAAKLAGIDVNSDRIAVAQQRLGLNAALSVGPSIVDAGNAISEDSTALLNLVASKPVDTLVIGNPPFSYAREFIESWRHTSAVQMWLLPSGFLGSKERNSWLRSFVPAMVLSLPRRPSFAKFCRFQVGPTPKDRCGKAHSIPWSEPCQSCGADNSWIEKGTDSVEYNWMVYGSLPGHHNFRNLLGLTNWPTRWLGEVLDIDDCR